MVLQNNVSSIKPFLRCECACTNDAMFFFSHSIKVASREALASSQALFRGHTVRQAGIGSMFAYYIIYWHVLCMAA